MKAWMGLLLLLWAGATMAASVYRWIDANGGVHFGEHPPTGVQSQHMNVQPAPSPDAGGNEAEQDARRNRLLHAFDTEQAQQQKQAREKKQQEAVRARNCVVARDRLRALNDSNQIYSLDAKGKRHYYSDSQRKATIQSARDAVDKWCD